MSFDLTFLAPDAPPEESMDELGQLADDDGERPLGSERQAQWEQLAGQVKRIVPNATEVRETTAHELSDDATGVQLSMNDVEIALSVPYWHSGDQIHDITDLLSAIAFMVEEVTGLRAFDPQSGSWFIGQGDAFAAGTMTSTADVAGAATGERRSWFRRLGRRRS